MGKQWMIVYTRPRNEKKVADLLTRQSIDNYCPIRRVLKQWSDRRKYVDEVIIRSYVFVRIEENERIHVLQTPGVLNFVYWLKKPAIVRDEEMDRLKTFLAEYQHAVIEVKDIPVGAKAKIIEGPLVSHEGEVIQVNKNAVSIRLYSAGLEFTAVVDKNALEVVALQEKKSENKKLINRIK
ncbi:transcriptional regulator [Thermaurantimonas aggregans]|uniref:Transcriptional regulator n=1 Tax=Thermaurantimonas aggregans TaxID=2173829 RepID=A0A401XK18_9FLAO|nr:UpxY family transcription antiterminator [Thermaurantimonas aggregans]MCX8148541.1 UpxY family transcription antiterminator [Thermaurantimonas aggregans]GCD77385.1 transcriptional regulator [Thermaurantimonas aggregans]